MHLKLLVSKNKRPRGLDALLGHLPDRNMLDLCLNSRVAATYVAEVTHI